MDRPVAFFGNGLGDGVIVLPALRALASQFGTAIRFIVNQTFIRDDLIGSDCVVVSMPINERKDSRSFDRLVVRDALSDRNRFISFAEWYSDDLDRLIADAGLTRPVRLTPSNDRNQFDVMFSLITQDFPEAELERFNYPLRLPDNVQNAADEIAAMLGSGVLIGFHPEGSYEEKSCSPHFTASIARHILSQSDDHVLCIFGVSERLAELEEISNRVVVFNTAPFPLGAALVSKMSKFVGVDSSFLHVADLAKVPGVGLFGPTDPNRWGLRFSTHSHLRALGRGDHDRAQDIVGALERLDRSADGICNG